MSNHVLLLKDLHQSGKDYLQNHNCKIYISKGSNEDDYIYDMLECNANAIFVRNEMVTQRMMDSNPSLKVIAKHGVGYDNIDISEATKRKIQVVYAPAGNTVSVAEHTIMLILNCAKRTGIVDREFKSGNYDIRYTLTDTHEISGMTLGLLGYGNIAKAVAEKAIKGFNMKVIAYSRSCKSGTDSNGVYVLNNKQQVLKSSDFVSIHMPSTVETRHSIGMHDFKEMKNTAYIINTSRGNIINESELIEALKFKVIEGAGLDVFEHEPVLKENPLLAMPQVISTPHTAGMTEEASKRICLMGAIGIVQALNGQEISWPVNDIH